MVDLKRLARDTKRKNTNLDHEDALEPFIYTFEFISIRYFRIVFKSTNAMDFILSDDYTKIAMFDAAFSKKKKREGGVMYDEFPLFLELQKGHYDHFTSFISSVVPTLVDDEIETTPTGIIFMRKTYHHVYSLFVKHVELVMAFYYLIDAVQKKKRQFDFIERVVSDEKSMRCAYIGSYIVPTFNLTSNGNLGVKFKLKETAEGGLDICVSGPKDILVVESVLIEKVMKNLFGYFNLS